MIPFHTVSLAEDRQINILCILTLANNVSHHGDLRALQSV